REEKLQTIELAAAGLVQPDQVRMGEGGRRRPMCELAALQRRNGGNQLQQGKGKIMSLVLGQIHRAVIREAHAAVQREDSVDNLLFPLRPRLGHRTNVKSDSNSRVDFTPRE